MPYTVIYLVLGVALWLAASLLLRVSPSFQAYLESRFQAQTINTIQVLLLSISVALIISGWRSAPQHDLYIPYQGIIILVSYALPAVLLLTCMQNLPPDATGKWSQQIWMVILLWSMGHVLVSGTVRSLVLFTGIGAWSVMELILLHRNREDSKKQSFVRNPPGRFYRIVIAVIFLFTIVLMHDSFFGVDVIQHYAG